MRGAVTAYRDHGVPVVLTGVEERLGDVGGLAVVGCTEEIGMAEEPASAVRRKKDSSLVRAAELVRDSKACAMVSAGNTGAAMVSALLRIGRIKGIYRPAIATPIPNLVRNPTVMLDSGANAECSPAMLAQFAVMGALFSRARYGVERPRVALLSIGEESGKGTSVVQEAHRMLEAVGAREFEFAGNVEGRDLMKGTVDVVVTDGFTGNVALKSLEGSLKFFIETLTGVVITNDETKSAGGVLFEYLAPVMEALDPDNVGGAMLLGVDGICVISHGSSSAKAIASALRVARDLAATSLLDELRASADPEVGAAKH